LDFPNDELLLGSFDFLIQVFAPSNPEKVLAELASYNDDNFDDVLTNIPIENSLTDGGLIFSAVNWSNGVDVDGDGYSSYARLNFDLDVNRGSVEVFVIVGVRFTDPMDTSLYYLYFESNSFVINGATTDDAVYLSVGLPNDELPEDHFDFLIQVFATSDPEFMLLELASYNDDDFNHVLTDVPFEEYSTDAELTINNAYWENLIDNDEDGYATQADLVVDIDDNPARTSAVYLAIYQKSYGSSTYSLLAVTETFTINGVSSADAVAYTVKNLTYDIYDFRIDVYYDVGHYVEATNDPLSNSELNDVKFELAGGWIRYDDSIYEDSYSPGSPSYLAVRFNKPEDAVSCIVREIFLYTTLRQDTTQSYAQFKIWNSLNNLPDTEIWGTENVYITFTGNNYIYPVDVDVSAYDEFFVGYYQVYGYAFHIAIDTSNPDSRSYEYTNYWSIHSSFDLIFRIYVEYTTAKNKNSAVTHGEWLSVTAGN